MRAIHCIRCHREYYSAAKPHDHLRCPVCGGRLEGADDSAPSPEAEPLGVPAPPRADTGSYERRANTYPSLTAFARADRRRGPSPEIDVQCCIDQVRQSPRGSSRLPKPRSSAVAPATASHERAPAGQR